VIARLFAWWHAQSPACADCGTTLVRWYGSWTCAQHGPVTDGVTRDGAV
jgi:uncharacterized Zn finger protein (UPF0148 family)